MSENLKKEKTLIRPGISYQSLAIFGAGLLIGLILLQLFNNHLAGEKVTLSTVEIISFILGTALSISSIVLSLMAIVLSKITEETIADLVTEGKDLQHQIFSKNQEVLSKLESSTGITEKRIDDIARAVSAVPRSAKNSQDDIKEIIRQNLPSSGITTISSDETLRKFERTARQKSKEEFDKGVMVEVSNMEGLKIEKMGEGSYDGSGYELADLVFTYNGGTYSLSTFYVDEKESAVSHYGGESLKSYIYSIAGAIGQGTFQHSFFAFSKMTFEEQDFKPIYKEITDVLSKDIVQKLHFINGTPKEIALKIAELVA
jgi:hypothetical protein